MSQYTSYYTYQKYQRIGTGEWTPVSPSVYSIDGEGTMPLSIKNENDPACGYNPPIEPIYRWVNMDISTNWVCDDCPTPQYRTVSTAFTCVGYDKHYLNEYQISYNSGVSWTTTSTTIGDLVEANSEYCGYTPPIPTGAFKIKASYRNSETYSAECDSNPILTRRNTGPSGYNAYDMLTATIGNCVTSIDSYAFGENYTRLKEVTIPSGVTEIGYGSFYGCSSLSSVTIWEGSALTRIGNGAFNMCGNLKRINSFVDGTFELPNSLRTIESYAFSGCSGLVNIDIPSGVTTIGSYAFDGCSGLTNVTIPDTVTTIGFNAFSKYDLNLPIENNIRYADTYAVGVTNDFSLTTYTIKDGTRFIGNGAFGSCTNLRSITIPDSVIYINSSAFGGCSALTSCTIGNNVANIGQSAFSGCKSLSGITIPNSVTSIGQSAFWNCSGLTSIDIPDSVTTIGSSAFERCSGLTDVTIGSGITSIGNWAFSECSALTFVTINATTPPILEKDEVTGYVNVFAHTNAYLRIYVPCDYVDIYKVADGWSTYASKIRGIPPCGDVKFRFVATYNDLRTYSAECTSTSGTIGTATTNPSGYKSSAMTTAEIGDCITSIGTSAFTRFSGLTNVIIPNSVSGIETNAFSRCYSLSSVTIPNSVTSIGGSAFRYCSGATSISIGNGITNIKNYAFAGCTNLTSVTIYAATPPTLGIGAFDNTNNCIIYVPSSAVDTYKAASGWSTYASRITAIPNS